jgi:hypothetical protein
MNFKDMIKEFNRQTLEDANAWRKDYYPELKQSNLLKSEDALLTKIDLDKLRKIVVVAQNEDLGIFIIARTAHWSSQYNVDDKKELPIIINYIKLKLRQNPESYYEKNGALFLKKGYTLSVPDYVAYLEELEIMAQESNIELKTYADWLNNNYILFDYVNPITLKKEKVTAQQTFFAFWLYMQTEKYLNEPINSERQDRIMPASGVVFNSLLKRDVWFKLHFKTQAEYFDRFILCEYVCPSTYRFRKRGNILEEKYFYSLKDSILNNDFQAFLLSKINTEKIHSVALTKLKEHEKKEYLNTQYLILRIKHLYYAFKEDMKQINNIDEFMTSNLSLIFSRILLTTDFVYIWDIIKSLKK